MALLAQKHKSSPEGLPEECRWPCTGEQLCPSLPGGKTRGEGVTLLTLSPPALQPWAPIKATTPPSLPSPEVQCWRRPPSWADRSTSFWRNSSWPYPTGVTRRGGPGGCAARAELNRRATQKGTPSARPGRSQTSCPEKGWGYVDCGRPTKGNGGYISMQIQVSPTG